MATFEINDPVHVKRGDGPGSAGSQQPQLLEGIVAYVGKVSFDEHGADDWVGVRLTGSSVGLGKNNGTVKDVVYFQAPPNCGIFVHASVVTKRTMTRLEALRLKRELASSSSSTTATESTAASTAASSVPTSLRSTTTGAAASGIPRVKSEKVMTTPPLVTSTSIEEHRSASSSVLSELTSDSKQQQQQPLSTIASPPSVASKMARSKIEEIRKRRTALQERKGTDPSEDGSHQLDAHATGATGVLSPRSDVVQEDQFTEDVGHHQQEQLHRMLDFQQMQMEQLKTLVMEWEQKYQQKELEATELQTKLTAALEKQQQQQDKLQQQQQQPKTITISNSSDKYQEEEREDLLLKIRELETAQDEYQDQLHMTNQQVNTLKRDLEREKELRAAEQDDVVRARSEAATLQNEVAAMMDQATFVKSSDTQHYKERAKLQAEVSALKRKLELAQAEKLELENAIEELTLDKEQLQEEKDSLEDAQEELKIDLETAQLQVDELRMELEDAQQMAMERIVSPDSFNLRTTGPISPTAGGGTAAAMGEVENKAHALALQNARLREALLRLREQSSVEKMELARQLRVAEKEVETVHSLQTEVEALRALKANLEDQINDLKDMLEESSAYESMVEDLSDRVLSLEEDLVLLRSTIREMEEAAELTSEMEEVQADEIKALSQDLEGRDTIIRNLEEAIKMQRRREEDYRRSVSNYRTTVETLKLEKQALMELQQGGEGEKKGLIAASQKALARAAQLVADSAAMRKREAQAVMDKIDHQIYRHLSIRLETLLPPPAVSTEVAAIKGELLTSKLVSKAAQSLIAISKSFGSTIRPPIPSDSVSKSIPKLVLSDDTKADVAAMFHQAEFAHEIAGISFSLSRLLAAGQWPDLLSPEASMELGSLLGHSLAELDNALSHVLLSMKEEGSLTPEQSNIDRLRQVAQNTIKHIESDLVREVGGATLLVPADWVPPGLTLLKSVSVSKYSCMGAAAALSAVVQSSDAAFASALNHLYSKVEQCSAQASSICLRLANLDVKNSSLVYGLEELAADVNKESSTLLQTVKDMIVGSGDVPACEKSVESTFRSLSKMAAMLRSANLQQNDDGSHHPLSPEVDDTWGRLAGLARLIRALDGDVEDVNYILRARQVETHLATAVEKEPKLEVAESKIVSLEKNLAARLKEIAMQNARLSELERVLAKSNVTSSSRGSVPTDFKSSKEFNSLMEENRVLMEAMDVLQRQVDEYENEIRALKDFKSPSRRNSQQSSRTPRRVVSVSDLASPKSGSDESIASNISLEATLFRPALQEALRESWKWKAAATHATMATLQPLPGPFYQETGREDEVIQLASAIANMRMKKASIKLIDLTNKEKTPRAQFQESRDACLEASRQVETLALRFRGRTTL